MTAAATKQTSPNKAARKGMKRLARLVAVQALFQADLMQQSAVVVLKEFEAHRLTRGAGESILSDADTGETLGPVDVGLMRDIVALALQHRAGLEEILAANLPATWPLARLERPLRMILLAGLAEIQYQPETALAIIISDYVDVAHAYFGGKEPGMINALLDKAGKALRG